MYFLKLRWFSTSSLRFKFPVYDISLAKYSLYLIITSHLPLILSFLCISQCHTLTFFLSLGNTETVYYLADTFCDKLHENYTWLVILLTYSNVLEITCHLKTSPALYSQLDAEVPQCQLYLHLHYEHITGMKEKKGTCSRYKGPCSVITFWLLSIRQ